MEFLIESAKRHGFLAVLVTVLMGCVILESRELRREQIETRQYLLEVISDNTAALDRTARTLERIERRMTD